MDFQSLSRRELQTLCKKNKIPANMTNVAMADALTALTNVEGIEDIGKTVTTGLETPLTSRRTTTSRKATKSHNASIENEPKSSLALTRSRRGTRRILQEDEEENKDPKDLNEIQSVSEVPKTPTARTSRKKATGTSVSRKINTQVKEDKEGEDGKEKEIPLVPRAYSTRRSTRLQQSEQKLTELVQKKTGRRKEAVKIDMMSEEETDNLEKKSEVTNEGTNMMVLNGNQDDLVSEDVGSTVVSAESSSSTNEAVPESFTSEKVEESIAQPELTPEASADSVVLAADSSMNIDQVVVDESSQTQNLEESNEQSVMNSPPSEEDQKVEVSNGECLMNSLSLAEEQNMNNEDDQATEIDEDDEEVKNIADVLDESSPLKEEKTENLELKLTGEDEQLYDVEVAALQSETWDFGSMKDSLQELMGNVEVEKCNLDDAEKEYKDDAEQENQDDADLTVPSLRSIIVSLPSEDFEAENSIANDEIENQMVEVKKSVPIADDVYEDLELESDEMVSSNAVVDAADLEASAVLDVEVDWPGSEVDELIEEDTVQKLSTDSVVLEKNIVSEVAVEEISFSFSATDPILNQIPVSLSTPNKITAMENKILVTPLKSSGKKKATTTPKSFIKVLDDNKENKIPVTPLKSSGKKKVPTTPKSFIKVLDDNKENNESGKICLKSNSKMMSIVAEAKENDKNSKGQGIRTKPKSKQEMITADVSMRKLKKILKEMSDASTTNTAENNKNIIVKEQLQLEKRSALQTLNGNSLVGEKEN